MSLPKIELTEDTWSRLEALRECFRRAKEASLVLAEMADSERQGALNLTVRHFLDGPQVIHNPAVRFRMAVDLAMAVGLEAVARQLRETARSLNGLLEEHADFAQDDYALLEQLVSKEVREALAAGE